jgi:ribosomal protein S12 methylthiotransferase
MGTFTYSIEPGTPATKLDGHLPENIKKERRDELMTLQQKIAFEHADSLIGYELDVLIDGEVEENVWVGRSFTDAPEIDACTYVSGENLEPGSMVPVEILRRDEYDLIGIAVDDVIEDTSVS